MRQSSVKFAETDAAAAAAMQTATESAASAFTKARSFRRQKSSARKSTAKSVSNYSDVESHLSSQYKVVEGLVDKQTAMRIQKMCRAGKKTDVLDQNDFISKLLNPPEETKDENGAGQAHSETDSSLRFQQQQREEFNSEMDIYSEIESVKSPASPGRRRGTLQQQKTLLMKAIPAEDSAEERGSDSGGGSDEDGSQKDEDGEGQESEQEEESHEVASGGDQMDERENFKREIMQKEAVKKEEEELCGPRLKKKIDEFIF